METSYTSTWRSSTSSIPSGSYPSIDSYMALPSQPSRAKTSKSIPVHRHTLSKPFDDKKMSEEDGASYLSRSMSERSVQPHGSEEFCSLTGQSKCCSPPQTGDARLTRAVQIIDELQADTLSAFEIECRRQLIAKTLKTIQQKEVFTTKSLSIKVYDADANNGKGAWIDLQKVANEDDKCKYLNMVVQTVAQEVQKWSDPTDFNPANNHENLVNALYGNEDLLSIIGTASCIDQYWQRMMQCSINLVTQAEEMLARLKNELAESLSNVVGKEREEIERRYNKQLVEIKKKSQHIELQGLSEIDELEEDEMFDDRRLENYSTGHSPEIVELTDDEEY